VTAPTTPAATPATAVAEPKSGHAPERKGK
jgi:hypothetical protein